MNKQTKVAISLIVGLGIAIIGYVCYIAQYPPYKPIKAPIEAVERQTTEIGIEALLDAIEFIESGGDPNAVGDNGNAVGSFQIWKIYVDDVNRIIALYMKDVDFRFTYKDRWDKDESRTMVGIYTNHYAKYHIVETWRLRMSNNEVEARIHNAGPNGWRNDPEWFVRNRNYTLEKAKKKITNAKKYWAKVKARLEE